jgi:hypothetical protein
MPIEKSKAKPTKRPKRTWQRPSVKTGTLFESNSLACGKMVFQEECQQGGTIKTS